MFKSLGLIFVVLFVEGALSQVIFEGECPKVQLVQNFNMENYSGVWYNYAEYPIEGTNDDKCNYAKYIPKAGKDLTVSSGGLKKSDNQAFVVEWPARVIGNGELSIDFNGETDFTKGNYQVLGTDNVNWAAAYDCKQLNSTHHAKKAWLLTRTRFPFGEIYYAEQTFIDNFVEMCYFVITDQYRCPARV